MQSEPIYFQIIVKGHFKKDDTVFYIMEITCTDDNTQIEHYERYKNLLVLHHELLKEYVKKEFDFPQFPPKKLFGAGKESFILQREKLLKIYFINLCSNYDIVILPTFQKYVKDIFKRNKKKNEENTGINNLEKNANLTEKQRVEIGRMIAEKVVYFNLSDKDNRYSICESGKSKKYEDILIKCNVFSDENNDDYYLWDMSNKGWSIPDGKDINFKLIEKETGINNQNNNDNEIDNESIAFSKMKEYKRKIFSRIDKIYKSKNLIKEFII